MALADEDLLADAVAVAVSVAVAVAVAVAGSRSRPSSLASTTRSRRTAPQLEQLVFTADSIAPTIAANASLVMAPLTIAFAGIEDNLTSIAIFSGALVGVLDVGPLIVAVNEGVRLAVRVDDTVPLGVTVIEGV